MVAKLSANGSAQLQATLDELTQVLPCAYLSLATPEGILFDGTSGVFDKLEQSASPRPASQDDVIWFASTTKLLTAVCYLKLVDQGKLTLDTNLAALYPPLGRAAAQRFLGLDENDKPIFEPNSEPLTLRMMLNQTSGFGMEFGEVVPLWKKVTDKGKGFVNSCKVENLVHTPIVNVPGTKFEYGNSAEWLALILPTIAGVSTEDYLQEYVCKPLGMKSTTYYPFSEDFKDRLMPLRYGLNAEKGDPGSIQWEVLDGQLDLLTLPRTREAIEYPAGGGGIYSKTSDYVLLLRHLLTHYLSLRPDSHVPAPTSPILSSSSVMSLFTPTLPASAYQSLLDMYNPYLSLDAPGQIPLEIGEADWSTAMAIYQPRDRRPRGGFGRKAGSVGWGGAAGTEYFMDPETEIACVFSTQMLPGRNRFVAEAKEKIEKAVYGALAA
ncbi:beta-lactamase/transpeptidase-like protein [Naematelia encephala]|uniref:Beta-lactamase/transpeptidase-like protein n=1 Tax=Naematelia encephala TaxID=71784 RepID=A0A1Y2B6X8_9TREE|nr:beta-lactamase/transpeptidase-like protein [Naematelia encephala]